MAKKEITETPVVFGADADETLEAGAVLTEETTNTPTENEPTDAPTTPSDEETESEETESKGGYAQAKNLTPTTLVETGTIPQTDTAAFAEHVRHIMNGDIREDDMSLVADKMVNEAHSFQLHKPVINSFPATGAEYLKTLDFQVSQD